MSSPHKDPLDLGIVMKYQSLKLYFSPDFCSILLQVLIDSSGKRLKDFDSLDIYFTCCAFTSHRNGYK